MNLKKYRTKSPWILHYNTGSCNGCDVEILACLAPKYDIERFGILNRGNPKQSDILLVTGPVTKRARERLIRLYMEMPEPKVVVAVGVCACTGGVFRGMYNVENGVDKFIPVDVYVPGCAARPENIIDGVVRALEILEKKKKDLQLTRKCTGTEELEYLLGKQLNRRKIVAEGTRRCYESRRD
ncbi:NADH dehydrogenase (quinone) [Desulfurobacterium thermolithotrophum DSM 11699]|uniref:NADH dehydrogenase (Quinone) n=1 Tax=Desulfurobacterium thermolithotrophum (strain DSM 11699 / BSA) TaxID=868864 RepID=F0S3G6_DESTD|nr:NADH-quinone oxidoreductase subunit NuoB [Desulfurobacterium thermolithotrophum]ADY73388.1 NADH dehydrogenase (quinone) [Desulfurobacterium thermolithotrophum DSM 11699]